MPRLQASDGSPRVDEPEAGGLEVTLVEFVRVEMTAMGSDSGLRVLEVFLRRSRRGVMRGDK